MRINELAPYTLVRRDYLGRLTSVEQLRPVQIIGLEVWNFVLWKRRDAYVDRVRS